MDDGHIWGELLIIILLVLANGACSLAEIAIVGAKKTKLQEMIDAGSKNAVYALRLAEKKEELFSTIQVGITTISIMIIGTRSFVAAASPRTRAFLLRSSQASIDSLSSISAICLLPF